MDIHNSYFYNTPIKPKNIKNVGRVSEFREGISISIESSSLLKKYPKPLIWVDADDLVISAFEKISSQNVLSAPVYCSIKKDWASILDIKDLCKFIVSLFDENNKLKDIDYKGTTVRNILSHPDGTFIKPCPILSVKESILSLLKFFHQGHHRVCISLDKHDKKQIAVVSELNLVKWMDRHKSMLGETGELNLEEIGMYTKDKTLISINCNSLAIDAFRILAFNNIYGLPIVSDNGEIMDNISVVDIKFTKFDLAKFMQPLSEFFIPNLASKYPVPLRTPIICTPQSRLREVIGKITSCKVHRIFIADEQVDAGIVFAPKVVVSVSDIVRVILIMCGIDR
ncbi:hypothetical protein DLAC_01836 [Tieghemostelium lacteum]|uniref:Cystathionine-beta-synthase domain-containing protein n=1 Tax=Tieghemostelium lacteum TaxID=361077 RepID=A0A152A6H1_TIELA|nr:hypothetical protein DLAC_01836 [Tieghemostelium lacteum]|eukprot:KYR01823.1 hypothetical protein DLAC_01836 [Tieghemostelium lacteum]